MFTYKTQQSFQVEIEPVEPASDVTAKAVEHVVAKQV
jgi:hypothetical protein